MSLTAKRVLLVDDSVDDAELAIKVLSDTWPVSIFTVVHDGADASDYLFCRGNYAGREPVNPTLILLDIKMPKVGGLELLREIKSNSRFKTIPVVILSSSREATDVAESYGLGSNAYVVKPLIFHEFVDVITKVSEFWLRVNEPVPTSSHCN